MVQWDFEAPRKWNPRAHKLLFTHIEVTSRAESVLYLATLDEVVGEAARADLVALVVRTLQKLFRVRVSCVVFPTRGENSSFQSWKHPDSTHTRDFSLYRTPPLLSLLLPFRWTPSHEARTSFRICRMWPFARVAPD